MVVQGLGYRAQGLGLRVLGGGINQKAWACSDMLGLRVKGMRIILICNPSMKTLSEVGVYDACVPLRAQSPGAMLECSGWHEQRPSSYPLLGPKYPLLGTIYPQVRVQGGSWSVDD